MKQILPLLTTLLLAPAVAHSADTDPQTLRVFIFAGQSNMVGTHSKVTDIHRFPPFSGLDKPQKDVLYSYKLGRENMTISKGWIPLQPAADYFGPELSFGRRVAEKTKLPIAIIKCASGGTSLGEDWNPDTPGGFKLYPLALEHVRSSLAELDRKKVAYRIVSSALKAGQKRVVARATPPTLERGIGASGKLTTNERW